MRHFAVHINFRKFMKYSFSLFNHSSPDMLHLERTSPRHNYINPSRYFQAIWYCSCHSSGRRWETLFSMIVHVLDILSFYSFSLFIHFHVSDIHSPLFRRKSHADRSKFSLRCHAETGDTQVNYSPLFPKYSISIYIFLFMQLITFKLRPTSIF